MKQGTISIPRRMGWLAAWAIFTTTIRAYIDGSSSIEFSIHEEEVNRP